MEEAYESSQVGPRRSLISRLTILLIVRRYARLVSPLPRDEVRRRIAAAARSGYAPGDAVTLRDDSIPLLASGPVPWKLRAWSRAYRDQGVRARFVIDDEVVLEPWMDMFDRLSVDACRVRLGPARRTTKQEPAPPTALVCEFFVPDARQYPKVMLGIVWTVVGLSLAVGGVLMVPANPIPAIFFVIFGGLMALVGIISVSGARPIAGPSHEYVLTWFREGDPGNAAIIGPQLGRLAAIVHLGHDGARVGEHTRRAWLPGRWSSHHRC
jgi:hypothetical protein